MKCSPLDEMFSSGWRVPHLMKISSSDEEFVSRRRVVQQMKSSAVREISATYKFYAVDDVLARRWNVWQ